MAIDYTDLADLQLSVGGAYPDRQTAINDALTRGLIWPKFVDGMADSKYVSVGLDVNQPIKLRDTNVAREYGIAEDRTWIRSDALHNLTFYNRKTDTHYVYTDDELVAAGVGGGASNFDAHAFIDLKMSKEQDAITSKWNKMDAQLAAVPDPDTMEGPLTATAIAPHSIFQVINEWTNGLPTTTPGGTAFTTHAGQSPTATGVGSNYTCVQETYSSDAFATYDTPLEALSRARRKSQYPAPRTMAEYFEVDDYRRAMILCSNLGMGAHDWLNQQGQDTWTSFGESGVPEPKHHGVPLTYWAKMDDAAIYDNGSSGLVAENSTSAVANGPRYIGCNGNFMHPVINSERFWYVDEIFRNTPAQPETWIQRYVTWWNLQWSSLRRHFHVAPKSGGSLFTAAF